MAKTPTVTDADRTDAFHKRIEDYLAQRIDLYRIADYGIGDNIITWDKHGYGLAKLKMNTTNFGLFKLALKACSLRIQVWQDEKSTCCHTIRIGFRYDHINGGSNGCDTSILLFDDGSSLVELDGER